MIIKIPKAEMLEILDSSDVIEKELFDHSRWTLEYKLIFKYKDRFYRTFYSRGATEMQDEGPWEYQKEVECEEVHQVEKVVKHWDPICLKKDL